MMQVNRELRYLLMATLLGFVAVALAAAYQAVPGAGDLLARDDNPRLVEDTNRIQRGNIYDRNGTLIAQTIAEGDNPIERAYLYPETASFTGYFSHRYGEGGAEAAYNSILRGDTLPVSLENRFEEDVLHRPHYGSDIRLTLDLSLQQSLTEAMQGQTGAAIVLSIPNGDVLSLVSLPTYDPNILDDNWDTLIEAPGEPFFNRVLQGSYQPGGLFQTPLMTTALLKSVPPDTRYDNADSPVQLDDTVITCSALPEQTSLTLQDAHAYGCPQPFAELITTLNIRNVNNILTGFQLSSTASIPDFSLIPETTPTPESTPEATPELNPEYTLLEQAMGQANLTVNPLSIARMTAAIMNNGNAPQPRTLLTQRAPEEDWQSIKPVTPPIAMITVDTARQLQTIFRANMQTGAAMDAYQQNSVMGGHAALAYSGEDVQAWFTGYIRLESGGGAVIAIVIENSADVSQVSRIAGEALSQAATLLQAELTQP